ncbi:hypothetical protein ACIBH1_46985 [Nonomuraea sp. NPDC050663]|uniref:hypothetical protein n=1 Tax=Nonomuraea sp. NPDC050663 TaxID=3364370 RepID=UPI00379C2BCD
MQEPAAAPYRDLATLAIGRIATRVLDPGVTVEITPRPLWEGQRIALTAAGRELVTTNANKLMRELQLIGWHVSAASPRPVGGGDPGWACAVDVLGWSEEQVTRRAELLRQALTGRLASVSFTRRLAAYSAATHLRQLQRPVSAADVEAITQLTVAEIREARLRWPIRLSEVADLDRCSTVPALQRLLAQVTGLEQTVAARCRRHEEVAAAAATDLCELLIADRHGDTGRDLGAAIAAVLAQPLPDDTGSPPPEANPVRSGMERLVAAVVVNRCPADAPAEVPVETEASGERSS